MDNVQKVIKELLQQKKENLKGNIYHGTQVIFAYNSNHIEGSRLTEDQTEMIYETNSFIAKSDTSVKTDDVLETMNHFRLFDYMLDHYQEKISKEMILTMHQLLKRNTSDELNPRFNVGGFKKLVNEIGFVHPIKTTPPEKVENALDTLIDTYYSTPITLESIIHFHVIFERIHPLSDGNGRVGRMLLFKECIAHNIMPFVILDEHKDFYIRGLKEYDNDKAFLIDCLLSEQDYYTALCERYRIIGDDEIIIEK